MRNTQKKYTKRFATGQKWALIFKMPNQLRQFEPNAQNSVQGEKHQNDELPHLKHVLTEMPPNGQSRCHGWNAEVTVLTNLDNLPVISV